MRIRLPWLLQLCLPGFRPAVPFCCRRWVRSGDDSCRRSAERAPHSCACDDLEESLVAARLHGKRATPTFLDDVVKRDARLLLAGHVALFCVSKRYDTVIGFEGGKVSSGSQGSDQRRYIKPSASMQVVIKSMYKLRARKASVVLEARVALRAVQSIPRHSTSRDLDGDGDHHPMYRQRDIMPRSAAICTLTDAKLEP